jgi:hypothetical protein
MKSIAFIFGCLLAPLLVTARADADTRLFEMRTYHAAPGKLEALHARFRNHTMRLFEKHGMTNIGYWVPVENNNEQILVYVLAFPDRAARDASWKAFGNDPDWKKAAADSEKEGKLVTKVDQRFLVATNYSPALSQTTATGAERIFELRTYTTTPGNLPALDARFRDHTMKLFERHGMKNLVYWHLAPGQADEDKTLVYLLVHPSVDAAKKAFEGFRADPDWVAAKKASEERAGGSLTIADGVKSVFLKPTDYSPLR